MTANAAPISASHHTPPSLPPSASDPANGWERRSTQILTSIRCFVDGVRTAPSLGVCSPPTAKCPASPKKETLARENGASLLIHLKSLGVIQQVEELQQQQQPITNNQPGIPESSLGQLLQNQYESDERKQILHRIIFPLLRNLEQCYEVLDNLPQTPQSQSMTETMLTKTQSQSKSSRNRRKNTTPPPLGMLSINDYTNVACMLEFAISASLVPCLEYPNVYLPSLLPPQQSPDNNQNNISVTERIMQIHKIDNYTTTCMAQKRNQALPKSLAGRISKTALTWGTMCAAENHTALRDELLAFSALHFHTDRSSTFPKDPTSLQQMYQMYSIFQAYNEMTTLATTIGHVLLLDRFRPMLLPRHLSDVYLTVLIAERLRWYLSRLDKHAPCEFGDDLLATLMDTEKATEERNGQRLLSLQKGLLLSPLVFPSSFISVPSIPTSSKTYVDCREAALAYRNLLGGGASMIISGTSNPAIPMWLRLRLGQCLTKLAQEDLRSVVDVFVAYARGPGGGGDQNGNGSMNDDVMTGAAARLARALCAKPTGAPHKSPSSKNGSSAFHKQLCSQFVDFLAVEGVAFMEEVKANQDNGLARSRSSMAMYLTLWATIAQLPIESLHSFFISKLISGLVPLERDYPEMMTQGISSPSRLTAMQSTAAIAVWLFTVPSSLDRFTKKKVQSFLLAPWIKGNHVSLLGQTLRLAASFSHENTTTPSSTLIVDVNGQDDVSGRLAEMTIAQMVHLLVQINASGVKSSHDRFATEGMGLLKAVSSSAFDNEGYCFEYSELDNEDQDPKDESKVYRRRTDIASDIDPPHPIEAIQGRAKCLLRAISPLSNASDVKESDSPGHLITSTLFRLVLLLHFSTTVPSMESDSCEHRGALSKVESNIELFGFKELLKSNRDELKIAATVLLAVLCEDCAPMYLLGNGQGSNESDMGVLTMLGLIIDSAAVCIEEVNATNTQHGDSEELLSTTCIVLSLLIALLELGAKKRSDSDESFFKTILPSLHTLSSGSVENGSLDSAQQSAMSPELAEMASHAMALIAARGRNANLDDVQRPAITTQKSRLETIIEAISQAECELQSSQPPLRAKAVVSLRHIARSLVQDEDASGNRDAGPLKTSPDEGEVKALVTEIKSEVPANNFSAKDELALISRTLARICLNSLADSESYVYLASIQTLVAISDVCPSEIMPLMGALIAKGKIDIDVAMPDTELASVELSLSPEQRIKATEALIFMIRRRGDGIFMYGPSLLETMLFGANNGDHWKYESKLPDGEIIQQSIQSETHSYFSGDKNGEADMQVDSDEKKIRLNTGGPVFSTEELAILRAGAISVVCELVSVLDPTMVASYCHILVRLATDALQLDSSRPVRRVAACLARDLYACMMKEVTAQRGSNVECTSTMAIAIVNANEESMYNAVSRCVSADDLDVNAKTRLLDLSTQSRSAEAIETRLELEAMGVFQAATLIAHSLEQESKDPNVQAVRRALSRSAM
ncbi:hypothetical protein ACHAXR_009674 [Thalassiosira sp. AJA248-18]